MIEKEIKVTVINEEGVSQFAIDTKNVSQVTEIIGILELAKQTLISENTRNGE